MNLLDRMIPDSLDFWSRLITDIVDSWRPSSAT
jgi:hypothetical protein